MLHEAAKHTTARPVITMVVVVGARCVHAHMLVRGSNVTVPNCRHRRDGPINASQILGTGDLEPHICEVLGCVDAHVVEETPKAAKEMSNKNDGDAEGEVLDVRGVEVAEALLEVGNHLGVHARVGAGGWRIVWKVNGCGTSVSTTRR